MIGDVRVQEYSNDVERCVRRGVWVRVQHVAALHTIATSLGVAQ